MGWVLILLLVALVVVFMQRRKSPELTTPILYGLVALILIVSGMRIFRTARPRAATAALAATETFDDAICYMLGRALAEDVPAPATVLVIHGGAFHEVMQGRLESRVEALKEGLNSAGYTVEVEGPTEMPEEEWELDEPYLHGPLLMQYLARHPEAKAVVSLIGAPMFRQLPAAGSIPPMYVMGGLDDEVLDAMLRRGVVRAGAIYRTEGVEWDARPRRGMSREEVFDLRFRLVRPE